MVHELAPMPPRVVLYAIEGADFRPGTGLSPAAIAAVDPLVDRISR